MLKLTSTDRSSRFGLSSEAPIDQSSICVLKLNAFHLLAKLSDLLCFRAVEAEPRNRGHHLRALAQKCCLESSVNGAVREGHAKHSLETRASKSFIQCVIFTQTQSEEKCWEVFNSYTLRMGSVFPAGTFFYLPALIGVALWDVAHGVIPRPRIRRSTHAFEELPAATAEIAQPKFLAHAPDKHDYAGTYSHTAPHTHTRHAQFS